MGARARQGSSAKLNHLGGGVVTGSWSPFCLFMTADFLSLASAKKSKITITKSLLETQMCRAVPRTLPMHAASFPLNGSWT